MDLSFRDALDALGINAIEAADMFGLAPQTIRQMRLDTTAGSYRTPPDGWQGKLAKAARARGRHMEKIAEQLERGAA